MLTNQPYKAILNNHELRTPLNAIIGFTALLDKSYYGDLNEKQKEYVSLIQSSGKHLLSLINDLLDYAKIESGCMDVNLSTFDINDSIKQVYDYLIEQFNEKNVRLKLELDNNIELVSLDSRKFQQILINFLSNALKFTPKHGSVTIKTALKEKMKFLLRVTDTGIGITEEDQKSIFSEFYQVENCMNKNYGGIGIGLAISKNLVELQGGKIGLESKEGNGSSFWIELPIIFKEPVLKGIGVNNEGSMP